VPRPSPQTERVVTLLNALAADPGAGLTVAEIARRLGVDKATCYPMLAALQEAGWLLRHPVRRTFHLGAALVPIGRAASAALPPGELVHAALADLAGELRQTCIAIAPGDETVVVLDQARPPAVAVGSLRVGQRLPLRPPWGAVFIAWGDETSVERWLDRGAPADRARWRATLAGIRDLGAVVELDESFDERVRDGAAELGATATRDELQAVVERLVEELAHQREPVLTTIDDARRYPVVSINAPVIGADGTATLAIAAMGFGEQLAGTDIRRVLARVRDAADSLR
jgi:DNA-binding IclR family transcriptional regulator